MSDKLEADSPATTDLKAALSPEVGESKSNTKVET
jgi:hypothetical protein